MTGMIQAAFIAAIIPALLDLPSSRFDEPELDGAWELIGVEHDGVKWDQDAIRRYSLVMRIQGTRFESTYSDEYGDEQKHSASFAVDWSKNPGTWEATDDQGLARGRARLGIIHMDGDELVICESFPGSDVRPTSFATVPRGMTSTAIYRRRR